MQKFCSWVVVISVNVAVAVVDGLLTKSDWKDSRIRNRRQKRSRWYRWVGGFLVEAW